VHPYWWVPDGNLGGRRLSTQAFEDSKDGTPMSVIIRDQTMDTSSVLRGLPRFGLAAFTAAKARACAQRIIRDPMPEEPAHALVVGRKNPVAKRCLLAAAMLLVEPVP
jgi:hypothetical protein